MSPERLQMISRIEEMEERFDKVRSILEDLEEAIENYNEYRPEIQALQEYLESDQWEKDCEADERGEVPSGLPHTILDEESRDDLLEYKEEVLQRATASFIWYNNKPN